MGDNGNTFTAKDYKVLMNWHLARRNSGPFLTKEVFMIELNAENTITNPIRCSGRASDGPSNSESFAIVLCYLGQHYTFKNGMISFDLL